MTERRRTRRKTQFELVGRVKKQMLKEISEGASREDTIKKFYADAVEQLKKQLGE